jgi:hypothetical protein
LVLPSGGKIKFPNSNMGEGAAQDAGPRNFIVCGYLEVNASIFFVEPANQCLFLVTSLRQIQKLSNSIVLNKGLVLLPYLS